MQPALDTTLLETASGARKGTLYKAALHHGVSEGRALLRLAELCAAPEVRWCAAVEDGRGLLREMKTWGPVRLILRSGGCLVEVMSDLARTTERGPYWNDDTEERVHLHLDVGAVRRALLVRKVGHASGRIVRFIAFLDGRGDVQFKALIPRSRAELFARFDALMEAA